MLDTDTSSYIIKRSNEAVLRRFRGLRTEDPCISLVTRSELLFGLEVSPRRGHDQPLVETFLRYLEVLDLTEPVASHYAEIRAALKRSGQMIGANDLFLAAHARSLGLTLVTNNVREFGRVPGLRVENWTEAAS